MASGDTGLQTGMEAPGRTIGFEFFDEHPPEEIARVAAARAVGKLSARPAPSGKLPVVLRRGAGGVLFHEACGHGLEADLVNRDASVFRGLVGERVAGPGVTLVDDGTLARDWGACAIDDEGAPAQRNVLIDDGILTDYMWDLVRARREGRPSSANGRRETYQHLPMVRMTNTYITPGAEDPDEIIRQTPYGLYCVALGGGQVNTATGDFVFGITEAYMIEDGRITEPVRAAQLIGNGPEALRGRRRRRLRLRDVDGDVRQGRSERAGLVGAADPAGGRAHRGRHGGVSEAASEIVVPGVPGGAGPERPDPLGREREMA